MPIKISKEDIEVIKTNWITTTLQVSTTATLIPTTTLTNRKTATIHNTHASRTLYLGPDNTVTSNRVVGVTAGLEVGPGERVNFDISDDITVYGIVKSGTIKVKITEFA